MKNLIGILIVCLTFVGITHAEKISDNMNEVSLSAGITFPQGTFNRYTDDGFYAHARFIAHLSSFKAISGFADLSGSFFKSTEDDVILTNGILYLDATERISEYSVALHLGTMVGSDSRNSFFRPKFGIAGGLYLFNTETLILNDAISDEPLAEGNQTQLRVGWRGIVGTDLFFTPQWGLSFEFTYDHVLNLHHFRIVDPASQPTTVGQTARFNNFSIGVIFPLPFD